MNLSIFSLLVCLSSISAFHLKTFRRSSSSSVLMKYNTNEETDDGPKKIMKRNWKNIPAILGTACLLLASPMNSFGASSGGRSGGSSFRSSPSRPSSTRLNSYSPSSSYGYSSTPLYTPMPMYSPFGFGFGISPFSFIPINFNLLLIGGIAYAVYTVLSNRIGGSDFSNENEVGSLGSGSTVVKLTIGLDEDWSKSGNIMETLANLASRKGSVSSRSELSSLLSDASLALLRKQSDWNSASVKGERFGGSKAEPFFQRLAIEERSKFEKETQGSKILITSSERKPTQAIVTIIAVKILPYSFSYLSI